MPAHTLRRELVHAVRVHQRPVHHSTAQVPAVACKVASTRGAANQQALRVLPWRKHRRDYWTAAALYDSTHRHRSIRRISVVRLATTPFKPVVAVAPARCQWDSVSTIHTCVVVEVNLQSCDLALFCEADLVCGQEGVTRACRTPSA